MSIRKSAFDRTREMHNQLAIGLTIAPAVHMILLKELADEHRALLAECQELRATLATTLTMESGKKASK